MKTFLLTMLLCSVLFLAVCRAETDEFALFDEPTKPKAQPNNPAPAPVAKAASPQPLATSKVEAANPVTGSRVEKLKEDVRKNPTNIALIQQLAEELYKNNQIYNATALLWKYVEKVDRTGLVLLARAHEKKSEADQMIKAMNILTSKNLKDFEAYYLLGNAYFIKNKNKETLENYKTALELNSKYEPAYQGLVRYYEKRKNLYELRILYQDMIDNVGPKQGFLGKLCEINTADGTYEAAMAKCREALEKNPRDADSLINLGLSQKGIGSIPEAEKTLKNTADKFPQSEFAQFTYGHLLEDQKNYVDSFNYYKAGASADPQSGRSWLGVSISAFELQKFDIAFVAFKKACKLDRKNSVYFRKATTQLKSSKNIEWARKYEEASDQCSTGG